MKSSYYLLEKAYLYLQASIFRTFQGWLALSSTGPGEGTLCVFPDVLLSNTYLIMRPFFHLKEGATDLFDKDNWIFGTHL